MGAEDGPDGNPVLEAQHEVATRIRDAAEDNTVRDLGIVAAGQQALHYWIASFGTMAAYAKAVDMVDVASQMGGCLADAKRADDAHTELATKLLG